MTLTEFLLARIADQEAAIRARDPRAPIHTIGCYYYFSSLEDFEKCDCDEDGALSRRALAECEAKRRIVEKERHAASARDQGVVNPASIATEIAWKTAVLLLAQPYADHPDFDETWRP